MPKKPTPPVIKSESGLFDEEVDLSAFVPLPKPGKKTTLGRGPLRKTVGETLREERDRLVKGRQYGQYLESKWAKRIDELSRLIEQDETDAIHLSPELETPKVEGEKSHPPSLPASPPKPGEPTKPTATTKDVGQVSTGRTATASNVVPSTPSSPISKPSRGVGSAPSAGAVGTKPTTSLPTVEVVAKLDQLLHDPKFKEMFPELAAAAERERTKMTTPSTTAPATTAERPSTTVAIVTSPSSVSPPVVPETDSGLASFLSSASSSSQDMGVPPHVVVIARAGTGKTTTIVEGLKMLRGGYVSKLTPSTQQQEVWNQILLSRDAKNVAVTAYNSSITQVLKDRVPSWVEAKSIHGFGLKSVMRAFKLPRDAVDRGKGKTKRIIAHLLGAELKTLQKEKPLVLSATEELVSKVKNTLAPTDHNALLALAERYDIMFEDDGGKDFTNDILDLVEPVLAIAKNPMEFEDTIEFDDMIWLPVALNLPMFRYDLLVGDEVQDWNRCQQEIAKKLGRRLVLVGDPAQAIYGFTGADSESMPRMIRHLSAGCMKCLGYPCDPGCPESKCKVLSLNVTRRCGKAIVASVKHIVSDFVAHESNPEGKIVRAHRSHDWPKSEGYYINSLRDGDMVLCRINAPLVGEFYKITKSGRKAYIQGKEFGEKLVKFVQRFDAPDVPELMKKITEWVTAECTKEEAKLSPNENRMEMWRDQRDCIYQFCEGASSVAEVAGRILQVFGDSSKEGVRLSSIHKAKGLESRSVFILQVESGPRPNQQEWQLEQEINLEYVARTRAIETLTFVADPRPESGRRRAV